MARYIARQCHPYRLPSVELEYLIYECDAFRRYLLGALEVTSTDTNSALWRTEISGAPGHSSLSRLSRQPPYAKLSRTYRSKETPDAIAAS